MVLIEKTFRIPGKKTLNSFEGNLINHKECVYANGVKQIKHFLIHVNPGNEIKLNNIRSSNELTSCLDIFIVYLLFLSSEFKL